MQSDDARLLLADLRQAVKLPEGPFSKSHSRAMSAAAAADRGRAGVDVEWVGANRDPAALAHFLFGSELSGADVLSLYRVWTFREAYFKAFGVFPDLAKRRALYTAAPVWSAPMRQNDCAMRFEQLDGAFVLCALWDMDEELIEIAF